MLSARSTELKPFGVMIHGGPGDRLSDIDPVELEELARREKLVLLRGFARIERDEYLAYCRAMATRGLLEWDFGPVMEMHEKPDAKNYLFSREAVPFHWDGAFHKVPTYLMFNCVQAPAAGAGGETLFCDTRRVWDGWSEPERARYARVSLTYETAKLAHYGGKITGPLVQQHPETGEPILRFAEPVQTEKNPVSLAVDGLPAGEHGAFLAMMRERVYAPENCYSHAWEEGDVLVADNHALIHGRRAFALDCPRHLRRIQVL